MTLCPCDLRRFPPPPDIPPGLTRLPRQIGLYGDFRAAVLAAIRGKPALATWQAREDDDLGLLLIEWWALVSDVVSFYTSEHAQALYLASADDPALRRLVALIGHRPRPAVATEAYLAALVDGPDAVLAPAGTSLLSDAVGDAPPQEFETSLEASLDPRRNSLDLAIPSDPTYDRERLILDPASRALAEDALFAMRVAGTTVALKVARLEPERLLDGSTATRLFVDRPEDVPAAATTVDQVSLWAFTQVAPVADSTGATLTLNGLWPLLREGELVLIEDSSEDPKPPEIRTLNTIVPSSMPIPGSATTGVEVPVMDVTLDAASAIDPKTARLHFARVRAGRLLPTPRTSLLAAELAGIAIKGPVEAPDPPAAGLLLVKGAGLNGVEVEGQALIDAHTGAGSLRTAGSWIAPDLGLRAPVNLHGNVLHVTRGKTVEEVLGDGKGAAESFQTFTLAKKPLTYVRDSTAPGGRRSTLTLYIDGLPWTEVDSLFTAGPEDRVYTVSLDAEGAATLTTGGEGYGLPAPLGVRNVFAVYRHGAGDPLPPAMGITQLNGPVANLRRVFNPTPAFGGAPASDPEDLRFTAPAAAATFDRAVSAVDFAALARDWGALAASATTEWVPERLREGVVVRVILEGGGSAGEIAELTAYLVDHAAETLPIRVVPAQGLEGTLTLTWSNAPDAPPETVAAALETAFTHPFTGALSARRAEIGGPVFRSALLGVAARVPGVASILSLTLNGVAMPARLALAADQWFAAGFEEVRV